MRKKRKKREEEKENGYVGECMTLLSLYLAAMMFACVSSLRNEHFFCYSLSVYLGNGKNAFQVLGLDKIRSGWSDG